MKAREVADGVFERPDGEILMTSAALARWIATLDLDDVDAGPVRDQIAGLQRRVRALQETHAQVGRRRSLDAIVAEVVDVAGLDRAILESVSGGPQLTDGHLLDLLFARVGAPS